MVLVSFIWGIFIFRERVRSLTSACLAILLMILGIWGMSFFSSPQMNSKSGVFSLNCFFSSPSNLENNMSLKTISEKEEEDDGSLVSARSMDDEYMDVEETTLALSLKSAINNDTEPSHTMAAKTHFSKSFEKTPTSTTVEDDKYKPKTATTGGTHEIVSMLVQYVKRSHGINVSIRQMGLVVCALGAAWGGSVMVPLKFAGKETQGLAYVFSFAVGAALTNITLWIIRYYYAYAVLSEYEHRAAWQLMPPFHFLSACLPCSISGVLWSIGNMGSILSVTYLGEGVGYSLCQSSILITGCWGIFWFREITQKSCIQGWLASACLAIAGILLLSYNHLPPDPQVVVLKD